MEILDWIDKERKLNEIFGFLGSWSSRVRRQTKTCNLIFITKKSITQIKRHRVHVSKGRAFQGYIDGRFLEKMLLLLSTLLEWDVCFDPLKKEDLGLINNNSIRDFYAFL